MVKNCIILGAGRSGTSMVAGCLSKAGYFMGSDLLPPTEGNPKGYFESREIEAINEELLAMVLPARPKGILGTFFRYRPGRAQRWLARVPVNTKIICPETIGPRIQTLVKNGPYCFKDPRFSYTLPAWKPYLKNVVFVCVFREVGRTIESILTEHRNEPYLKNLSMNYRRALKVWSLMYQHILKIHCSEGEWLFLHYNQLLERSGLDRLETALEASVNRDFPDPQFKRSYNNPETSKEALGIYEKLCQLAAYSDR